MVHTFSCREAAMQECAPRLSCQDLVHVPLEILVAEGELVLEVALVRHDVAELLPELLLLGRRLLLDGNRLADGLRVLLVEALELGGHASHFLLETLLLGYCLLQGLFSLPNLLGVPLLAVDEAAGRELLALLAVDAPLLVLGGLEQQLVDVLGDLLVEQLILRQNLL